VNALACLIRGQPSDGRVEQRGPAGDNLPLRIARQDAAAPGQSARHRQKGVADGNAMPPADWNLLPEAMQLALTREALRRAAETLAEHAELLAIEMEEGALTDRGGPEALRLFAAVVRATQQDELAPMGRA
jgi:hypothetical protein